MQLDVFPSTERGWERIMAPTYSLRLPKKCHWCQYETVWFSHNLDRNFVVLETFWVYPLPPPRRFFMKDSWKETCKFNASSMRNDWTFYCQFKSELFHVFLCWWCSFSLTQNTKDKDYSESYLWWYFPSSFSRKHLPFQSQQKER